MIEVRIAILDHEAETLRATAVEPGEDERDIEGGSNILVDIRGRVANVLQRQEELRLLVNSPK